MVALGRLIGSRVIQGEDARRGDLGERTALSCADTGEERAHELGAEAEGEVLLQLGPGGSEHADIPVTGPVQGRLVEAGLTHPGVAHEQQGEAVATGGRVEGEVDRSQDVVTVEQSRASCSATT